MLVGVVHAEREQDAERPPQHRRRLVADDLTVRDERRQQRGDRGGEDADARAYRRAPIGTRSAQPSAIHTADSARAGP